LNICCDLRATCVNAIIDYQLIVEIFGCTSYSRSKPFEIFSFWLAKNQSCRR
jgi:hypothetical protein